MDRALQCICGHKPQASIKNFAGKNEFVVHCTNCRIVYAGLPQNTLDAAISVWNDQYTEAVKMIVQRAMGQSATIREELLKICGRTKA